MHAKFQFLLHVKIIINYFQSCIIRIIHNNNKPSFTNHHSRNNHNKKNKNKKKRRKKIIQYKIRLCLMFPLQTKSPWSFHFSFQQFYDFFLKYIVCVLDIRDWNCRIFFFWVVLNLCCIFFFGYYFNIIFSCFRYY